MIHATVPKEAQEDRTMINDRRVLVSAILTGILGVCLIAATLTTPAAANEVLKWNETAVKAATTGGQTPPTVDAYARHGTWSGP